MAVVGGGLISETMLAQLQGENNKSAQTARCARREFVQRPVIESTFEIIGTVEIYKAARIFANSA